MVFDASKYELIEQTRIEELKSDGFLLKHRKSGARVVILSNDDENKVFSIGFRTPPPDSTGVPHILEHSVLCGSAKYPAKDPFVELAKGSLNTFLNAMTYPDKTVYPIASCNDVDFKNIMDVYMDAVFNPNIYTRKEIFMQEGWHYELESADALLQYNGVVYNEMKGAFSSPDDMLARYCLNSLYPDTAYSVESGGDPECIPDLSYEEFLNFHRKLYHPSNSYIYLYGNCDMSERLEYLDREYLSSYDYLSVDSEIGLQKPFESMKRTEAEYSVTEDEGCENKACLAYNVSIGTSLDKELYLAFQVLDYALLSSPGAPVKQALIDAGIGEEVYSTYENGIRQPMLTIAAKNTDADRADEFIDIIKDTLSKIVKTGINKDALKAGINVLEFSYREADFGRFPKGLMYGLNLMDSWLYDETKPFIHLSRNDTYSFLKEQVETGYFEELVQKYILDNTHSSLVILKPVVNLTAINEQKTAGKLAAYKESLSKEEIEKLVLETAELKKYQSEPTPEKDLATIPLLSREDISKDIIPLYNSFEEIDGVKVDHHNIYTNGIGYLNLSFDISNVADEDIPYVGLLGNVIGYIDTENHSYDELSNEVDMHTGGILPDFTVYQNIKDRKKVSAAFSIKCKSLISEYDTAFSLINEMMYRSKYDDYKRLKEILAEVKSRLQAKILSAGHAVALNECYSQFMESARYTSLTSGIPYYYFVADLYANFDSKKELIAGKLMEITGQIFVKDRLTVSYTSDDEGYDAVKPGLAEFIKGILAGGMEAYKRNFVFEKKKIGYKTSSQVNYVARCGDFYEAGLSYNPSLTVLRTMMSYDYLWINIRVKGGAYGCMNGYSVSGSGYFLSYRDPNIAATNRIYEGVPAYVANYDGDEREMTKYILGTFSELDTPLTPQGKGNRSFESYMQNVDEDYLRERRLKILATDKEDIHSLEPIVKAILDSGYLCVIGNAEKIDSDSELFDEVKNLF